MHLKRKSSDSDKEPDPKKTQPPNLSTNLDTVQETSDSLFQDFARQTKVLEQERLELTPLAHYDTIMQYRDILGKNFQISLCFH